MLYKEYRDRYDEWRSQPMLSGVVAAQEILILLVKVRFLAEQLE